MSDDIIPHDASEDPEEEELILYPFPCPERLREQLTYLDNFYDYAYRLKVQYMYENRPELAKDYERATRNTPQEVGDTLERAKDATTGDKPVFMLYEIVLVYGAAQDFLAMVAKGSINDFADWLFAIPEAKEYSPENLQRMKDLVMKQTEEAAMYFVNQCNSDFGEIEEWQLIRQIIEEQRR